VQVRPLVEEIVKSPEEILELLQRGTSNRKTGATDWNFSSSRSHCVFTLVSLIAQSYRHVLFVDDHD
jgi:centromeric protein E